MEVSTGGRDDQVQAAGFATRAATGLGISPLTTWARLTATTNDSPLPSGQPSAAAGKSTNQDDVDEQGSGRRGRRQQAADTGPGDVRDLPAGLFCRDLDADGYSYSAAVDYWRIHGQPNQLDEDLNGIPCETVYPASDVAAYWGDNSLGGGTGGLPSGLFCRDLYARGYNYGQAVDYWFSEGAPDRMDEDLNGIPCETVYPGAEVSAFWGQ